MFAENKAMFVFQNNKGQVFYSPVISMSVEHYLMDHDTRPLLHIAAEICNPSNYIDKKSFNISDEDVLEMLEECNATDQYVRIDRY